METFTDWNALPAEIKAHFDALEDFVGGLDGQEINSGTIDASDAVKAVNGLAAEIARLRARPTEEEIYQAIGDKITVDRGWVRAESVRQAARAVLAPKVQP